MTTLALTPTDAARLDQLAGRLGAEPEALAQQALQAGLYGLALDRAVHAYRADQMSSGEAAEFYGVPRVEILRELDRRDEPMPELSATRQVAEQTLTELMAVVDRLPGTDEEKRATKAKLSAARSQG